MEKFDENNFKKYIGKTCLFKIANLKQDYYTIYVGDVKNRIMQYKNLPTDENWQYCDIDKFIGHVFIVSPFSTINTRNEKHNKYVNKQKNEQQLDSPLKIIQRLREETGVGMYICENALEECGYDHFDEAKKWLKEKGYEIATK